MAREKFGSRLGFILVSAGCAVGLGNLSWSLQDAPLDLETCGSFRIWRENMVERHLL